MKKLLIIAATILLAGCTNRVPTWVLLEAEAICAEHKGIDFIQVSHVGQHVMCKGGYWAIIEHKS